MVKQQHETRRIKTYEVLCIIAERTNEKTVTKTYLIRRGLLLIKYTR